MSAIKWKRQGAEIVGTPVPNDAPLPYQFIVPQTTTQRIIALEADVARLQWQVAKLLAKPTRRKKRK